MAKTYDNNMRGAIFVNKEKAELAEKGQDTEKWSDRKGSCEIDGVEYWISGWLKTSKAGDPYLSLSFERKETQAAQPTHKTTAAAPKKQAEPDPF